MPTKIEWTDETLNVVNGCSVISPGCTNCYAMRAGARGLPGHPSTGLTQSSNAGHVWTGAVRFNERALLAPLRWRKPRTIFWNAHGDLFHEAVRVRAYIHAFHREHRRLPSHREIARGLERPHGGYIGRVVEKLRRRGELPR